MVDFLQHFVEIQHHLNKMHKPLSLFPKYDLMNRDITENQRFWTPPDIGTRELGEVVRGRKRPRDGPEG